jgi:hypothetical protein
VNGYDFIQGFVKQLKLYEEMQCRLDPTNEEYKLYRLTSLALTMQGNQGKGELWG